MQSPSPLQRSLLLLRCDRCVVVLLLLLVLVVARIAIVSISPIAPYEGLIVRVVSPTPPDVLLLVSFQLDNQLLKTVIYNLNSVTRSEHVP